MQVLVGLANHAGPDGTGAFSSVATLVRYTGLSERMVPTWAGSAGGRGHHRAVRPGIVAARIKRADRRPQGRDLNLSPVGAYRDSSELHFHRAERHVNRPGDRSATGVRSGLAAKSLLAADLTGAGHHEPGQPEQPGRGRVVNVCVGSVVIHLGPSDALAWSLQILRRQARSTDQAEDRVAA
jgi:hypothetical protein